MRTSQQVLVLDSNQRSALAVTRSLGKHGVHIFTLDETGQSLAGASRYSALYTQAPSPRLQPERFVDAVTALCTRHNIEIVLPMTELTTTLLLDQRDKLSAITLPFADHDSVDLLADKTALLKRATSLGVPVPRTWHADDPDQLPFDIEALPYPLVLKPGKSWLCTQGEWQRFGVRFADSPAEAKAILTSDPGFRAHPFLLQESVPGHGQGVFALYDHGKPLAFFAHRRLREKPPQGGVSVLSESIPVDPVLLGYARALLDEVQWHGVAMVEFRVGEDGIPYLMEINTRFWGSLQLAIDAGVDFPWLLYQVATGVIPETVADYRTGVRLRWILGDLDNLYLTLRDRQNPLKVKLRAMLHFLKPAPFRTQHETNRWGDMDPFWYELKQYLQDLIN